MKPYQTILLVLVLVSGVVFAFSGNSRREKSKPIETSRLSMALAIPSTETPMPPPGLPPGFTVTEEPPLATITTISDIVRAGYAAPTASTPSPTPEKKSPAVEIEIPLRPSALGLRPVGLTPMKLPEEQQAVTPLPAARPKASPARAKSLASLNGTFACTLESGRLVLPQQVIEQLGATNKMLVSPGPDTCLWITNQGHLDRLSERLEASPASEIDVRAFRRLYFAQVERAQVAADGKLPVSERLLTFAGLSRECVLVGIDDHFELWDATKWMDYARRPAAGSDE